MAPNDKEYEISGLMDHIDQITIVGTGLLGGSCGLGLRSAGYKGKIAGVSRRPATAQRAQELGCVDTAGTDLGPPVRDSGLVIIATPLSTYDQVFEQLAQNDHPGLVITDVGSTKQQVCDLAKRLLPDPTRFVGSHPMAGREQHGPDAALADLFDGKPCVITAESDCQQTALKTVEGLWTLLKMRLVRMSADEHDRHVAHVSHLPHAMAVLLLQLAAQRDGLTVASTGFKDMTRLASGDPKIWLDIFTTNRQAILEALDDLDQELSSFRHMLSENQDKPLLELLSQSKKARDTWKLH